VASSAAESHNTPPSSADDQTLSVDVPGRSTSEDVLSQRRGRLSFAARMSRPEACHCAQRRGRNEAVTTTHGLPQLPLPSVRRCVVVVHRRPIGSAEGRADLSPVNSNESVFGFSWVCFRPPSSSFSSRPIWLPMATGCQLRRSVVACRCSQWPENTTGNM
jgi:putative hemolysin